MIVVHPREPKCHLMMTGQARSPSTLTTIASAAVEDRYRLIVQLLYGSGLRLLEALTLRVKDVDFARGQLTIPGSEMEAGPDDDDAARRDRRTARAARSRTAGASGGSRGGLRTGMAAGCAGEEVSQ